MGVLVCVRRVRPSARDSARANAAARTAARAIKMRALTCAQRQQETHQRMQSSRRAPMPRGCGPSLPGFRNMFCETGQESWKRLSSTRLMRKSTVCGATVINDCTSKHLCEAAHPENTALTTLVREENDSERVALANLRTTHMHRASGRRYDIIMLDHPRHRGHTCM